MRHKQTQVQYYRRGLAKYRRRFKVHSIMYVALNTPVPGVTISTVSVHVCESACLLLKLFSNCWWTGEPNFLQLWHYRRREGERSELNVRACVVYDSVRALAIITIDFALISPSYGTVSGGLASTASG